MDDQNSMDDKKLNFNRPLLSVRHHRTRKYEEEKTKTASVTQRPPPYRSELKSGPVRNPGVVPFVWENTPGQPKGGVKPVTVIAPKLPPGRNIESSRKETCSDSGDSEEAYLDARDTLSRTESFSLNCSMSGLSGKGSGYGLPGSLSKAPQAQEFMMDRFLPAAKAIASETTSQYLTKKQHVVQERVNKSVDSCSKPSLRYGPSFAKRYSHYQEKDDEEEESDDDNDRNQDLPGVCGLLPRFRLRSSLCLLNPVPAMSVRTRSRKLADKIQEVDYEKTKSRRNECGLERRHRDGSLPFREVKEIFAIPQVKMNTESKRLGSDRKGFKAFDESTPESPAIEKTLYVDTIQMVKSLSLDTTDSSHEDIFKKLKTINRDDEPDAFSISSSIDKPDQKYGMELTVNRVLRPDSTVTQNEETKGLGRKHQDHFGLPVPPPLPKSPSDSWLCRTLPSMAKKNLSLRLYPQAQFSSPPAISDTKWEKAIAKATKESLTTISET